MLLDLIAAALVAAITSLAACRALMGAVPVDVPGGRKWHDAPTPTSGGVGIAIGFAVGLTVLGLASAAVREELSPRGAELLQVASAFAYAFLVIGFLDDTRPIDPIVKTILFSAAAVGAVALIGPVERLPLSASYAIELAYGPALLGAALWVFVMVNCVNFMDGANGLAIGSVAIGLIWLGAIALTGGSPAGASLALVGAGALIGFLYWNYPSGRLFAGDSGALFAGAIASLGSLIVIHRTGMSPFAAAIIFFPLLADALLTLWWRFRRRQPLLVGHSEHVYQIVIRAGWGNKRVTFVYWVLMAVCGGVAFLVTRTPDSVLAPLALGAGAVIALGGSAWVRRRARANGLIQD